MADAYKIAMVAFELLYLNLYDLRKIAAGRTYREFLLVHPTRAEEGSVSQSDESDELTAGFGNQTVFSVRSEPAESRLISASAQPES